MKVLEIQKISKKLLKFKKCFMKMKIPQIMTYNFSNYNNLIYIKKRVAIIEPSRRFIKEGTICYKDLSKINSHLQTDIKNLPILENCPIFLFNDLLLLAKKNEKNNKMLDAINIIPLRSLELKNIPEGLFKLFLFFIV